MLGTQPAAIFNPEDFLDWEKEQTGKHEYVNGEGFALVGARDAHVTVALNVASLLKSQLQGSPCRTCISDMKARVEKANAFFYSDVFVSCDERDRQSEYFKACPTLIVEVLSESTAAFDRGRKFAMYRQLESLKEYVVIDPDSFAVDCFRRDASDHWVLRLRRGGHGGVCQHRLQSDAVGSVRGCRNRGG